MTDYNPAHKTSSITSITSTSTASTWDHPISNNYQSLKPDNATQFEEYPEFDASLVSERIAIPPFEYFEDVQPTTASINDSNFFNMFEQDPASDELPELLSSTSSAIKNDSISSNPNSTNMKNENHNQFTNYHGQPNSMTHPSVNHIEPIYLQHAHQMTLSNSTHPYIMPTSTVAQPVIVEKVIEKKPLPQKRQRVSIQSKEPISLTEDEKRANHIVSEQKRRNTIRLGFKELTDIVPTLKNINNSKSTILFKAVEFMKHLDKRNRTLKDKVRSLQIKLQLQGKIQKPDTKRKQHFYQQQQLMLPPDTISALIAHKNQQKQLEQLQNQLRVQHQLLQQHNIISPFDNSQFQQKTYHSILIPSSRSSESDETEQHRTQETWTST